MYVLWFALGIAMFILYGYIEWKIVIKTSRGLMRQQKVVLPDKKHCYVLGSTLASFVGFTAFYFGVTTLVAAEVGLPCWLIPALSLAGLSGLTTSARLKYASFDDHED